MSMTRVYETECGNGTIDIAIEVDARKGYRAHVICRWQGEETEHLSSQWQSTRDAAEEKAVEALSAVASATR